MADGNPVAPVDPVSRVTRREIDDNNDCNPNKERSKPGVNNYSLRHNGLLIDGINSHTGSGISRSSMSRLFIYIISLFLFTCANHNHSDLLKKFKNIRTMINNCVE